jgi:hypothetical protein
MDTKLNSNGGYRPREAAVAIVSYVNSRNPNVAMLALNVCLARPSFAHS